MSVTRITQADRSAILTAANARAYRKTARIVALRMRVPFEIETDRGLMEGRPGDFIVTNHPEDDPGSDVWSISRDRMASTYVETSLAVPLAQQDSEPWLTVQEAAQYLDTGPATVRRAHGRGELVGKRNTLAHGHPLIFAKSTLEAFRESRIKPSV